MTEKLSSRILKNYFHKTPRTRNLVLYIIQAGTNNKREFQNFAGNRLIIHLRKASQASGQVWLASFIPNELSLKLLGEIPSELKCLLCYMCLFRSYCSEESYKRNAHKYFEKLFISENFRKILQNTLATASLCLNFSPYLAGTSKNQKNIFAEFKTFIQLTIPSIEKSS